jgi:protein-disulfide isomerase
MIGVDRGEILSMDRRFLAILAGLVILFVGIFVVTQHSSNSANTAGGSKNSTQATKHVEGLNQKNITLVEYGDYQCPICGAYYQPLKEAVAQLNNDIQFQFRNLPLVSVHPNAFAGARAAEAAGLQGKYWQMHDKLYENQDPQGQSGWVASQNPLQYFDAFAQQIGLNTAKFDQDYKSTKVNDAINADLAAFNKTGKPEATPTFFLDGKYVNNLDFGDSKTGQPSAAKIVQVVNAEVAKKNSSSN